MDLCIGATSMVADPYMTDSVLTPVGAVPCFPCTAPSKDDQNEIRIFWDLYTNAHKHQKPLITIRSSFEGTVHGKHGPGPKCVKTEHADGCTWEPA